MADLCCLGETLNPCVNPDSSFGSELAFLNLLGSLGASEGLKVWVCGWEMSSVPARLLSIGLNNLKPGLKSCTELGTICCHVLHYEVTQFRMW